MTHNSPEADMRRVGFIGLGAMGLPMARNVMEAGFPLTVWARRKESALELMSEGAQWAESPRALAAASEVVITMVTNSPDVEDLVTRGDGLLAGASPGTVIVDMSTISPQVSRALAELCSERGVHF